MCTSFFLENVAIQTGPRKRGREAATCQAGTVQAAQLRRSMEMEPRVPDRTAGRQWQRCESGDTAASRPPMDSGEPSDG